MGQQQSTIEFIDIELGTNHMQNTHKERTHKLTLCIHCSSDIIVPQVLYHEVPQDKHHLEKMNMNGEN